MASVTNIETGLEVAENAIAPLKALLASSKLESPMLSIAWQGEGPNTERMTWSWVVKTVGSALLEYFEYVSFEKHELRFYCTHENMASLPSMLDKMMIVTKHGKPAIIARAGCSLPCCNDF